LEHYVTAFLDKVKQVFSDPKKKRIAVISGAGAGVAVVAIVIAVSAGVKKDHGGSSGPELIPPIDVPLPSFDP
jgi:hypothetical protein